MTTPPSTPTSTPASGPGDDEPFAADGTTSTRTAPDGAVAAGDGAVDTAVDLPPGTTSEEPASDGATSEEASGHGASAERASPDRPSFEPGPGTPSRFAGAPWTRVLFIGVVCFAVWLLLDAPSLQNSAKASPFGTRRTVSLDVLGPIAAVSRGLGLDHVVGWTDELLGRSQGGGPALTSAPRPLPPPARRVAHVGPAPKAPGGATTTTTTTLPPLDTAPTTADPLRVLVVGDSIGIDLGQPLTDDLAGTGVVKATLDGKIDTGLARPDYFNWPLELADDLAVDHPQLVVVMLGANDPQSMQVGNSEVSYGTQAWSTEYANRVGAFMDAATAAGARVLWVGMPPMASGQLNGEMDALNGIVQSQAAARPGMVTYVSSKATLGDGQGNFTPYVTNGAGAEVNVRTPDGIHLTPDGGEVLSQSVINTIRSALHVQLPG